MQPAISIVIPVYNVAPYLRECLDSVVAQTFQNWEAVCVDDGSTDGCDEILDEYAAKDARIKVIHNSNQGVCAARNAALELANGTWIGFVDADDAVSPNWYSVWYGIVSSQPSVQAVKMVDHIWSGGDMPTTVTNWETRFYTDSNEISNYAASCVTGYCIARYMIKKDVIGNKKFITGVRINEDVIFIANILFSISSLCVCSYDGYFYRMRPGSALHSGITDYDIFLFIKGVENCIKNKSILRQDALILYKHWAGNRIITDILRCLVYRGIYPSKSISETQKLRKAQTIIADKMGIKKYCCMVLLLYGRRIGFLIVLLLFKLQCLCRKII